MRKMTITFSDKENAILEETGKLLNIKPGDIIRAILLPFFYSAFVGPDEQVTKQSYDEWCVFLQDMKSLYSEDKH